MALWKIRGIFAVCARVRLKNVPLPAKPWGYLTLCYVGQGCVFSLAPPPSPPAPASWSRTIMPIQPEHPEHPNNS